MLSRSLERNRGIRSWVVGLRAAGGKWLELGCHLEFMEVGKCKITCRMDFFPCPQ